MIENLQLIREKCKKDFIGYLKNEKRILFAYSGGLDSTACLYALNQYSLQYGIDLDVFTIDTGCKGHKTIQNIQNCIGYILKYNKKSSFEIYDYANVEYVNSTAEIPGEKIALMDAYKWCYEHNVFPCGWICNYIMDSIYSEIMRKYKINRLYTGGDSPKLGEDNSYSVFWKKQSGINVIRVGAGIGLTKDIALKIIQDNRIPWENPLCGGYDTDCLVPGVIYRNIYNGKRTVPWEMIRQKTPILIEYLDDRIRFGIYDESLYRSNNCDVEIADNESYNELVHIFGSMK